MREKGPWSPISEERAKSALLAVRHVARAFPERGADAMRVGSIIESWTRAVGLLHSVYAGEQNAGGSAPDYS